MRKLSFLLKVIVFLSISFLICFIGLYIFAYISPPIELKSANQFSIYDDNDELVFQGSGSQDWVSIDSISPYIIDAVISTEDKNFYEHKGFDYLRIIKTLFTNFKEKRITAGASTISQQYIKNMFLTFDKTWERKLDEAFLTVKLEVHYTKDQIMEGYLNTIDYGNGNYGIENASRYYFNKHADELTLEEAIILAGIPKSPNNYNPIADRDKSISRARAVATSMIKNNRLDDKTADNLVFDDIEIYGKRDKNNLQTLMYYQNAVIDELKSLTDIPMSLLASGGIRIFSNLNIEAQTEMEKAIINNMSTSLLEVASVIIDPKTGGIIALSGGYDYAKSQYNRATSSERQVGSSMKPLLYYTALENNLVSSSRFMSAPTTFNFSNNETYSPANYGNIYGNKEITMAAAIAYSDNIYAVKTHLFLGEENLVNISKRMGIRKNLLPIPSLPLGTIELNMMDFANAYTTLASGGYKRDLFFIRRVEDLNGRILYEKKEKTDLVLNPNQTYILNELLTSTYNSSFIDYNNPTSLSLASKVSRKYASKTGSTGADFWMVGYNPDILMIVWNGLDDGSEINVNDNTISKKIWVETVEEILKDKESDWYEKPRNVVGVIGNAITGEFTKSNKNSYVFYYVKGFVPDGMAVSFQ